MKSKKRILVTLIVLILVGIAIFPMLPLEYRDRIIAVLTHPLYSLGLRNWSDVAWACASVWTWPGPDPLAGGWVTHPAPPPPHSRSHSLRDSQRPQRGGHARPWRRRARPRGPAGTR